MPGFFVLLPPNGGNNADQPLGTLYLSLIHILITIEGRVLKCYPKYLLDATTPKVELKQVLKLSLIHI